MSAIQQVLLGYFPKPILNYLGSAVSNTSGTSHTFTGMSLGTPSGSRYIIGVTAGFLSGTASVLSTTTINGVSSTVDVNIGTSSQDGGAIFRALVPSGISGTVVVNWSSTNTRCAIHLWELNLNKMLSLNTSGTDFTNPLSLSLTAPDNSALISVAKARSTTGASSWSGFDISSGHDDYVSTTIVTTAGKLISSGVTDTLAVSGLTNNQIAMLAAVYS